MTAKAELLPPLRTLKIGGEMFRQSKPKEIDYTLARKLDKNPRFKVTGLDTKEAIEDALVAKRPEGELLMEAIRDAVVGFDEDDENYDRAGKPSVSVISDILGYPIDTADRDRALGYNKAARATGKIEEAEGARAVSAIVKKKIVAATPTVDPSTQGAITA